MAILQQFYRNIVGAADKRHMAVAWRAVDGDTGIQQPLAGRVNVIDPVSQVSEITAFAITALVPVMRQLDLCIFVVRGGKEDQCEAPSLIVETAQFFQSE